MMGSSRVLLFVLVLLGSLGLRSALAQIGTDRPGFADGAVTVDDQIVQAELGYAVHRNGGTAHDVGQLLLRGGLTDRIELRGRVGSLQITDGEPGYDGAALGTKVSLFDTPAAMVGVVAMTDLPLATTPRASDRARQELALAFTGALSERVILTMNTGTHFFFSGGPQNDRASEGFFVPTLALGLSETVGAFFGYAGFYGTAGNRNWIEGGLTLLANDDTQLDLNGAIRVDTHSDTPFVLGLGVAHRF
jgi:hypothetical protein